MWRVLLHTPSQFLFCLTFLAVAAWSLSFTGGRVYDHLAALFSSEHGAVYRWCFLAMPLTLPFAVIIAYLSVRGEGADLSGLTAGLAQRVARAEDLAFGSMQRVVASNELLRELEALLTKAGRTPDKDQLKQHTRTLIPEVARASHDFLRKQTDEQLAAYLTERSPEGAERVVTAVPLLQVVYDPDLFDRATRHDSGKGIVSRSHTWTQRLELGANLGLVGQFLGLLWLLVLHRNWQAADAPVDPVVRQGAYLLYIFVAMLTIWLGLRIFSLQQRGTLLLENPANSGIVFASAIMLVSTAGYLLYVVVASESFLRKVAELTPLVVGAVSALVSLWDPLAARRVFGAGAKPWMVAMLVVAYVLMLALWWTLVVTRR